MKIRKFRTPVIALSFALAAGLIFRCGEGLDIFTDEDRSAVDWTQWSYKRPVAIQENSASSLSDYQVNITFDNSNFSFANADPSGNDLRFNYNDTSLPYWIESWNQAGETGSVWVKVPSLPAGAETTIYVYYGNSGETAASSFDGTFTKNFDTPNLVARWHMDEGSGTSIADSSPNSNTGSITGASWVGSDNGGWYNRSDVSFSTGDSLSFDGSGDYVTVADDNTLEVSFITIEAWLKTGLDTSTRQFVLGKWDEPTDACYAISIESDSIYFYTNDTGNSLDTDDMSRGSLSTNTWYHVTATSDGTNKIIYINGTQSGTSKGWAASIYTGGNSDVRIGMRNTTTTDYFSGIIAEISIYSGALSAQEIEAHSKRVKYVSPPPTCVVGAEQLNQ